MRLKTGLLTLLGLALSVGVGSVNAQEQALKVGDKAPDFTLTGTDDKTHSLKDYLGKKTIVIAWYPKALTGG